MLSRKSAERALFVMSVLSWTGSVVSEGSAILEAIFAGGAQIQRTVGEFKQFANVMTTKPVLRRMLTQIDTMEETV